MLLAIVLLMTVLDKEFGVVMRKENHNMAV